MDDKDVLDIILFGSFVKGKEAPGDIDIAIISNKDININIKGFHVSLLKPEDFIENPPLIINTLLREGHSLKKNCPFSMKYKFSNKILFKYELVSFNPSIKVKIVNILRGKNNEKGMVIENKGEWLSNQVFFVPIEKENIFERFFINFKIKYKKFYILIH